MRHNFAFMKNINILVSGASGLSGSLIARELIAQQQPVRALVRNGAKAKSIAGLTGLKLFEGDMLAPDTLKAALDGVKRVIMISSANDRMVETQCSFIDACIASGVAQVIKFSDEDAQNGFDPERFRFTREHEQIEDYLEKSGLQWTHLRPSQFMQVYLREAEAIRQHGTLRLPLGDIRMSPVDLGDVARVAAALLIHGGHNGSSLRMTGPEALSMADVAHILAEVSASQIRYVPIPWAEREAAMSAANLPSYFIDAIAEQTAERIRHPEAVIDISTHQLFDVKPTRFAQFAERHASIFKTDPKNDALTASV